MDAVEVLDRCIDHAGEHGFNARRYGGHCGVAVVGGVCYIGLVTQATGSPWEGILGISIISSDLPPSPVAVEVLDLLDTVAIARGYGDDCALISPNHGRPIAAYPGWYVERMATRSDESKGDVEEALGVLRAARELAVRAAPKLAPLTAAEARELADNPDAVLTLA